MENLGERFRQFQSALRLSPEEQADAEQSLSANAKLSFEYIFFIILSAVVATLGLITNSAPVIIGAMVLAPLMNPVLGIALGVVRGDLALLWEGLKTLAVGLTMGFFIAVASAWMIPEFALTAEILGRTHPTVYDLFIGMAAGAGGALGQARRSVAGVLPGAAIAVALMPPLCVTGISFSLSLGAAQVTDVSPMAMVYGSTLLWLANLAAINLSAIVIFAMLGFRRVLAAETDKKFRRRFAVSAVLVGLITLPLLAFLQQTIDRSREEKAVRASLVRFTHEVLDVEAELVDVRLENADPATGWRRVVATVYSPRLPERDEVLSLRAELEKRLGDIDLKLTVNPVHTYRENPEQGSISDRPNSVNPSP